MTNGMKNKHGTEWEFLHNYPNGTPLSAKTASEILARKCTNAENMATIHYIVSLILFNKLRNFKSPSVYMN